MDSCDSMGRSTIYDGKWNAYETQLSMNIH